MTRVILLLGLLSSMPVVYVWSGSTLGFLLAGVAPVLMINRYFLRLLPWSREVVWSREFSIRLGWIGGGTAFFYLLRYGCVRWSEAILLGIGLCLAVFLIEAIVALTGRIMGWRCAACICCLGAILLLPPLIAIHPLRIVPKRPPSALGLAFADVRIPSTDGVRLAGWLLPHAHARGNVLFCHGWGRNRGQAAGLLPALHEMGFNVLAFDFRGHGDSSGHTARFGQSEVQDLLCAAAFLREQFPGQPLYIIGVSYGAAVTLQALPHLSDVAGVWSEGCFSRMENVVANYFQPLPDGIRPALVDLCDTVAWLDCGIRSGDINPIDGLKRTTAPIYFCHGRQDELIPLTEAEALYQSYDGPKWAWWVDGADHYNVRQRNNQEYLSRLRSFLESQLIGTGPPNSSVLGR
jgi:pimeloyl-ACP methyl ester carboxylesterase